MRIQFHTQLFYFLLCCVVFFFFFSFFLRCLFSSFHPRKWPIFFILLDSLYIYFAIPIPLCHFYLILRSLLWLITFYARVKTKSARAPLAQCVVLANEDEQTRVGGGDRERHRKWFYAAGVHVVI